jgi:integrase
VAAWFTAQWGGRAASTWNVALDALRAAGRYWEDQGWISAPLTLRLSRRKLPADRPRALSRADVDRMLASPEHSLRERTLWQLLYETAARSGEVLQLDVQDLDLPNRRARVRRKGGAVDWIVRRVRPGLPRHPQGVPALPRVQPPGTRQARGGGQQTAMAPPAEGRGSPSQFRYQAGVAAAYYPPNAVKCAAAGHLYNGEAQGDMCPHGARTTSRVFDGLGLFGRVGVSGDPCRHRIRC